MMINKNIDSNPWGNKRYMMSYKSKGVGTKCNIEGDLRWGEKGDRDMVRSTTCAIVSIVRCQAISQLSCFCQCF